MEQSLICFRNEESDEEGIGTFVNVEHLAPAFIGEKVLFEATLDELKGNELNCSFIAKVGDRIIAKGRTGQKFLVKDKIEKLFEGLKK